MGEIRGDVLLDLELDDEINTFRDKFLRILDGGVRVVAIVTHNQLDTRG